MANIMNNQTLRDIFKLVKSKKNLSQKLHYLFKGLLFYSFLMCASKKTKGKGNSASVGSYAGDDIYPLF